MRAGVSKDYTYLYTKPFASQAYGYYTKRGTATLLINGEVMTDCTAMIGDFESFHSNDSDILTVYHADSAANVSITWKHKQFKAGEVYDLCDFHESGSCNFDFDYDYNEFGETNASCITVRPLVINRDGGQESVVYFYAEFENDDGERYTLEGLVAAPFGLAHQSKVYTGTGTGGKSNGGGIVTVSTFIPEHSKLDCLTCGGDGDCNSCGGSGNDYYGSYRTTCNTCNGSGNCRSCGGSGKR
ncbi:MAG: hypothetical protein IJC25_06815 [Clostridia bacterium]|nr:hypothetical protein [Clostridia bacterium]